MRNVDHLFFRHLLPNTNRVFHQNSNILFSFDKGKQNFLGFEILGRPRSQTNLINFSTLSCMLKYLLDNLLGLIVGLLSVRLLTSILGIQLFWLVHELIKSSANGCEGIFMSFMKQIVGKMSSFF